MLLGGQTTEFHIMNTYPFCPLHSIPTGFSFLIVHLSRKPHPSQMRLASLIAGSLGRTESCWKEEFFCTVHSHLVSFNVSSVCLGTLLACLLSNGANWRCQVSHELGKKWNWTNWTGNYSPDVCKSILSPQSCVFHFSDPCLKIGHIPRVRLTPVVTMQPKEHQLVKPCVSVPSASTLLKCIA